MDCPNYLDMFSNQQTISNDVAFSGVGPFPQAKPGANSTHEPTAYTRVHTQSHVHERKALYGSVSKPCFVPLVNIKVAGKWMFIPLKMAYNRYWSIPIWLDDSSSFQKLAPPVSPNKAQVNDGRVCFESKLQLPGVSQNSAQTKTKIMINIL